MRRAVVPVDALAGTVAVLPCVHRRALPGRRARWLAGRQVDRCGVATRGAPRCDDARVVTRDPLALSTRSERLERWVPGVHAARTGHLYVVVVVDDPLFSVTTMYVVPPDETTVTLLPA